MKFLINRTDAIGDTILTLPMADLIRQRYPEAKITFLVSTRCKAYLDGNPNIDQIIVYNHQDSILVRLKSLWSIFKINNFDYYFYVGGAHLPSFIAWIQRVPIRAGVLSKISEFIFLNRGKRQKRSKVEMHEAEYNLDLLNIRDLDINFNEGVRDILKTKIYLSSEEVKISLDNFFASFKDSVPRNLIFIHPGMSGHTLNWPGIYYAKFIEAMDRKYPGDYLYMISYTPSDGPYLEDIRKFFSRPENLLLAESVCFFDGSVDGARNYLNLLSTAKLFVGPSTGTLHMANALGVKSIGIFSPIRVQSVERWGPFNRGQNILKVVSPDVVCKEQFKCDTTSCNDNNCMASISVDYLVDVAKKFLESEI